MNDLKRIYENMTDEQGEELIALRGGCRCHINPPCSAHSDPLTMDEALELGLVEEETKP
jgi:hypothetical protein